MRRLNLTIATAFAALAIATGPAAAEPAMWIVRDADSEIRLFGSVHILPKDKVWRSAAFNAAFAAADEVWFETDVTAAGQQAAQAAALQFGTSPDRPLSQVLTPEQFARFAAAAEKLGLPAASLDPMRPWLAGLTLSVVQLMRAGFDPNAGVESVLSAEHGARPRNQFETPVEQIRFFADLREDVQIAFLMSTLDELDRGEAMFAALLADWAEGDAEGLERLFLSEMRENYAALYDVLITRRNAAWVERILEELKGSGTDFMVVGAGHLVGPDSVQAMLAARGVRVERVGVDE